MTLTISHRSRIHTMRYFKLEDKEYLVTGSEDKTIRIWDTNSGDCLKEVKGHLMRIKSVSVLETGNRLILMSASSDGVVKCWDMADLINKDDTEALGEYNTKCRITCITSHDGFSSE